MNKQSSNNKAQWPSGDQSVKFSAIVWRRLRRDKFATFALVVVGMMFIVSYFAPVIANNKPIFMRWEEGVYFPAVCELFPFNYLVKYTDLTGIDFDTIKADRSIKKLMPPIPYSPYRTDLNSILQPPSRRHWMGTDDLGHDVASRMMHGSGVSLKVGIVAVGIALLIGLLAGSLAGFYGGVVDILISRLIEVVMCFPFFFLILSVIAFLPPQHIQRHDRHRNYTLDRHRPLHPWGVFEAQK